MKKLLALVLAVVLSLSMASVALAAEADYANKVANPGNEFIIPLAAFNDYAEEKDLSEIEPEYLSTEYFTIKVEYSRGKDLVKEVKFDNDKNAVKIVLKDNVIERPSVPNFQIKSVSLTGKKDGVNKSTTGTKPVEVYKGKKYEPASDFTFGDTDIGLTTAFCVGYDKKDALIDDSFDLDYENDDLEDFITKFVNKATVDDETVNGKDYGVVTIDFDSKAMAEVRVYKDEKFYLGIKDEADLDIVKANPDAELEFLTFVGKPSFSSNAKVEIYADEDKYLYELKDGKLVESTFKYDDDASAFVGKARTLTAYVISDMKLVNAATTEETKNPDTGANDVVGVAVTLAVVSLVAAGAVSLKK